MQIGSSQRTARWQRETNIIISHAGREGKTEQKCRPVRREKSSERVPCAFCRYFEGYKRERGSREGVEEKMLLEKNDILNSCVAASTVAGAMGKLLSHLLFISSAWLKPSGRARHVFKTKPVPLHSTTVYKGTCTHTPHCWNTVSAHAAAVTDKRGTNWVLYHKRLLRGKNACNPYNRKQNFTAKHINRAC